MPVTSIPKKRLVNLILGELQSSDLAQKYFHINSDTNIEDRLASFLKNKLLEFILSLGLKGEKALENLSTSFPIRRSPTLYLAIMEDKPDGNAIEKLIATARNFQGVEFGMKFEEGASIRRVYFPNPGINKLNLDKLSMWEIQLQYEHKFEYVEANPDAENYGELTYSYSLETAMIWIPIEKYYHAIIACSDYAALRRIRGFFAIKLNFQIYPPTFNKEMLERITRGAAPRSATFTINFPEESEKEPQNITISDPYLESKDQFKQLTSNGNREQVSGFYTAHPGIKFGGIGVARRDGKIWTPRRLDHNEITALAFSIIKQTEQELGKTKDHKSLTSYFYLNRVIIGSKELNEKTRSVWVSLLSFVFIAEKEKNRETAIDPSLVNNLLLYQKELNLLTAIVYDCPSCGVRLLAKCTDCKETLSLKYGDSIYAKCPRCNREYREAVECSDCGEEIQISDFINYAQIIPDVDNLKSIHNAAKTTNVKYQGSWKIDGLFLKHISPKKGSVYNHLGLNDFTLWKKQAKIGMGKGYPFSAEKALQILNHTKEKCYRFNRVAKQEHCDECLANPINPAWVLKSRNMCLLRLFGIPIGEKIDGIHHGHEFVDIHYRDTLIESEKQVWLGIHVKSRGRTKPEGSGRSSSSVKGLYTQVIYSAYEAAVNGKNLDVIGIAMPNMFHKEVINSLSFAVNQLGFSLLVVEEPEWQEIVNLAFEQINFDFENNKK